MFEKRYSPNVPPMVTPIKSDFPLDETDMNVFGFQKQASDVFDSSLMSSSLEELWLTGRAKALIPNAVDSFSLVTALKNLIDVIRKSETHFLVSLTERDYQEFVTILDNLIDIVGENESHILVSLMDFVGTLIENYEDEHIPELTIV